MIILVTGAAGFIGSNLCRALLKENNIVIGIDNLNDYYDVNLKYSRLEELNKNNNFTFIKMDIKDKQDVDKLFDENNRRLYLTDEFSSRSGILKNDHNIVCKSKALIDAEKNKRIKIVDSEVIRIDTEDNIALTKDDFATNILNKVPPFDSVDISGFRKLFETIQLILKD